MNVENSFQVLFTGEYIVINVLKSKISNFIKWNSSKTFLMRSRLFFTPFNFCVKISEKAVIAVYSNTSLKRHKNMCNWKWIREQSWSVEKKINKRLTNFCALVLTTICVVSKKIHLRNRSSRRLTLIGLLLIFFLFLCYSFNLLCQTNFLLRFFVFTVSEMFLASATDLIQIVEFDFFYLNWDRIKLVQTLKHWIKDYYFNSSLIFNFSLFLMMYDKILLNLTTNLSLQKVNIFRKRLNWNIYQKKFLFKILFRLVKTSSFWNVCLKLRSKTEL